MAALNPLLARLGAVARCPCSAPHRAGGRGLGLCGRAGVARRALRAEVDGVRAAAAGQDGAGEEPPPFHRGRGGGISMRKTAPQMMGSELEPPEPEPELPCEMCAGVGRVPCKVCGGAGRVPAGGFHKKNRVDLVRVVGSKWTAMKRTLGWTHFEVRAKRRAGKDTYVEVVATCDDTKRLWVNSTILKDKEAWLPGWVQRDDLQAVREGTAQGPVCGLCQGEGRAVCPTCDGGDLLLVGGAGGGRGRKKGRAKRGRKGA